MRWTERTLLICLISALVGGTWVIVDLERNHTNAAPVYPTDSSPEAAFAREMETHHAQAVEMAVITRDRTTDPQIRELASDMALDQQQEVGQLRGLLAFWGLPPVGAGSAGHTGMQMTALDMPKVLAQLRKASPEKVGLRFLELMVPHHEAGVAMAGRVLTTTTDRVVRDLATSISRVQEDEIVLLQEMLRMRRESPKTGTPAGTAPGHAPTGH